MEKNNTLNKSTRLAKPLGGRHQKMLDAVSGTDQRYVWISQRWQHNRWHYYYCTD